jgi:hypothetical protein
MILGDNLKRVALNDARQLPFHRQPVFLLFLMAFAMPIAFSTWAALLNNFVVEQANFTGVEIGWLHTVREIPGFLAVGVIFLIRYVREQVLGLVSLILLGAASGITAWFPDFQGILILTLISSIGFHYYETVNQSLQLQWIKKEEAPQTLGWITSVGSAASLLAYGLLVATWKTFDLSYNFVYLTSGGITVLIALYCMWAFPQFEAPDPQIKKMILRRRYWLYYALQFMSGARRQIFMVFAGFMMVERFGFEVHEITALFLINYVATMIFAPFIGRLIGLYGERNMLAIEYVGLTIVFFAYGGIYYFGWGVMLGMVLYVLNHIFFSMAFALKTYFQKIADPQDIAPTAAVAFTINHIAAVFLPALLGYLWVTSQVGVFALAAGMAVTSLVLSLMIPRHPVKGRETVFSTGPVAAAAE